MQSISKRPTVEERFWSRVDKDGPIPELRPELGPCWIWTHSLNNKGYSSFRVIGVGGSAYRYSYVLHVGPIPDGYDVDHLCRNRVCVNPDHLEAVTHKENLHRSMESRGHEQARTHCPQGHEYTPENTFERRPGSRACEECRTAYRVKARLRNKTCPECGAVVRARGIARHRKLHLRAPSEQTGGNRAE